MPDVVCGTSAGAMVGAAYVLGKLDDFERWLATLEWRDVVGYLDFSLTGGVIRGRRLFDYFASRVEDRNIEDLLLPYGAVATDLADGAEVWLRKGSLREAVRASISIPVLFKPVQIGGRWCVDGGIANPVPVSLCRALGAEIVIAVDVNSGISTQDAAQETWSSSEEPETATPSLLKVVERSLYISQAHLTRSRLALDPPDILISPEVAHIGFLELHRAQDCFGCGRKAVEAVEAELARRHLGRLAAVA